MGRPDTSLPSVSSDGLTITPSIAAEPNISGSDALLGLQYAMAADASGALKGLVDSYKPLVSGTATTMTLMKASVASANSSTITPELASTTRAALIDQIIYKWTGVENIASSSRGGTMDAKQLVVLEKFMGESFVGVGGTADPNPQAANILNSAYANLNSYIFAQLESQTALKPLYDLITIEYDSETGSLTYNLDAVTTYIQNAINTNIINGQSLLSDFDRTLKNLGLKDSSNYNEFYNTFSSMGDSYKLILDTSDKTIISGTVGNDSLDGTASGEAYFTGDGNDTIFSRQGDDVIYADNDRVSMAA